MTYLKFDKALLINLEKSLTKEMIRTNRAGAYNSTTLIDCNTRKYHGQLVIPIPELDDSNHVLLSSLDETVIQHGAEFNLGIHKYEGNNFSPNGHKYIREFDCEVISRTTYRVGGVVLSKERLLVSFEPRVLIRYTLLEAHSPTLLRFKPFLAFRSVNELTHQNNVADTSYEDATQGIRTRMYDGYPYLYMQFSKKNTYHHQPDWYRNIEYYKEQERGYDYKEDLMVPGYFEMPIKKGESIIFSAGISPVSPKKLAPLWDEEIGKRIHRVDMYSCLKNSAQQFYQKIEDKVYLLAGYPWFKARARDQFIALPGCTFLIDKMDAFYHIMDTAIPEIEAYINGETNIFKLEKLDDPDVLLWFIRTIQLYSQKTSLQDAAHRYGKIVVDIIKFIRKQNHPNLFLHTNGLLYVNGKEKPATWMNAVENGRPITPRTGYVVEINALWYNALKFAALLMQESKDEHSADLFNYQAETTRGTFVEVFWNGTYLYDYVDGNYSDMEVRPNMVFAIGLPFSPLDRQQQKSVLDIITRELLTPKGLRTISPKSGSYRPVYIGGQLERDRNYHNGPVWPWLFGTYAEAYLKTYKQSGISFIERMLNGFEWEMTELCVSTISELFDGNPPFKGHGGMSFAMNVAEILRVLDLLKQNENENT
ncbi:4-alpha-glucanotransferase [Paludibacter sp. 221]|uniref:glycogen debranching enzyme N-terminal domain-containing protein n=1 Tax=Paludibacter sp. 221 TaxID=2302939 RepID=UPI0013CFE1FB|nr:glycogen debranching enzyme N-terminal domain-containing protein [Paludibacter sp. 221]NDV47048.1 4-alpha-glucanotransferase [Paludibacter sp. 221]